MVSFFSAVPETEILALFVAVGTELKTGAATNVLFFVCCKESVPLEPERIALKPIKKEIP